MPLLSEPRCPQCGFPLPTRQLWRVAGTNKLNLLTKKCGIVCPQCQVRLQVRQTYVLIFNLAIPVVAAVVALFCIRLFPKLDKDGQTIVLLAMLTPVVIFQARFAPCFAQVALVSSDMALDYPLAPRPVKPESDEEQAQREIVEAIAEAQNSEATRPLVESWICVSCGEENPGEFDICWKCQKVRPARGI